MKILILLPALFLISCASKNECNTGFQGEHINYVGHRANIPDSNFVENSVSALLNLLQFQQEKIEFDIQTTKDNKLIVFHDPNTCRTAKAAKNIKNTNYNDLPKLKNGEKIPTLDEYLSIIASNAPYAEVYLDLKLINWDEFYNIILKYNLNYKVIISSKDLEKNDFLSQCEKLKALNIYSRDSQIAGLRYCE